MKRQMVVFFREIHHSDQCKTPYLQVEVWGPSGPRLLVGGPSGRLLALLDFVLRALRALRPCDPRLHLSRVYTQANTITWYP